MHMEILPRIRVSWLKLNSNVFPLKNTSSHYLLLNTTIIPLCNSKISLIFLLTTGKVYPSISKVGEQHPAIALESCIFCCIF